MYTGGMTTLLLRLGQAVGVGLAAMTALAAAEPLDLTGTVQDPDGRPIEGATVFIYTAKPRVGPGYI